MSDKSDKGNEFEIAQTSIGKAVERIAMTIMETAAAGGVALTPDQMAALAKARDDAEETGKALADLQGGLSSVKPRDPLDHDGDGRKGGSLPKSQRKK